MLNRVKVLEKGALIKNKGKSGQFLVSYCSISEQCLFPYPVARSVECDNCQILPYLYHSVLCSPYEAQFRVF